jgi:3-oxoacyl-(acyl-carrier-protein) synthase
VKLRRVKITGIGPVTPAGIGREAFWKGIQEPVSRVRLIDRFLPEAGEFVGAEVEKFELSNYVDGVNPKRMPRHTQFAVAAAALAAEDAGLKIKELGKISTLIQVGSSLMDFGVINKTVDWILKKGPVYGLPSSVYSASVSAIGGAISELIGGTSRTMALQSACCAGLDSIGHAAAAIARGEVEVAICGGTESPLYFHPMLELKLAGLAPGSGQTPERQCRPFDLWRTTGVIGEGACVLILEPEESPRRGYAFVDGYSFVTDPAAQPGFGLGEAMRLSIANAGYRPDAVDVINAWGPGHRLIDAAEVTAIRQVFGERTKDIAAVSIKGAIGNPLGAAGAIQVGCAALGLAHSVVPPTVNWTYPDPACALSLSSRKRDLVHSVAAVNSHGLSGTNACLILHR